MRLHALLHELRDPVLRVADAYGAHEVRVFGSVARQQDGPASDVDLLVTLEPGRTLLDLAGLELALEALLGCRVDVATPSTLREPVRTAALREAVPL